MTMQSDTSSVVSITGRSDTHRVVIDFDYRSQYAELLHPEGGCNPGRCEECDANQDWCTHVPDGTCWVAGWFDNDGDTELLRGKIILTVDPEFDGDHTVLHVTGVELAPREVKP